jgi:hypothetical protein
VLPVIETEILPTKHYMPSEDGRGLVEVPTDIIANYEPSWEIVPKAGRQFSNSTHSKAASYAESLPQKNEHDASQHRKTTSTTQTTPTYTTPNADPSSTGYSRDNYQPRSSSLAHKNLEPILTSKKTYMTADGYPRTEYYWRHPPVFEDATGRTQPVYMEGLLSNELNTPFTADVRDESGSDMRRPRTEENKNGSLFRDSGYGASSSPGLTNKKSMSGPLNTNTVGMENTGAKDSGLGSFDTEQGKLARIERELDEAEAASRRADSTEEERVALGTKLQAIEQEMNQIKI